VSVAARSGWLLEAEPERVARFGATAATTAARADTLSALALTALARLLEQLAEPLTDGTAVVLGSDSATVELDELFDRRRREGRPVEPRRFPATSPNVGAGNCCIAFGFHGPAFTAGGGPGRAREALLLAHDLVAAGDAPCALAVQVEDTGPAVSDLFAAAGHPVPPRGARALLLCRASEASVSRQDLGWEV
jgi:3-oxoacyl-(acyl-carrier-protein) synthase